MLLFNRKEIEERASDSTGKEQEMNGENEIIDEEQFCGKAFTGSTTFCL